MIQQHEMTRLRINRETNEDKEETHGEDIRRIRCAWARAAGQRTQGNTDTPEKPKLKTQTMIITSAKKVMFSKVCLSVHKITQKFVEIF